MSRSGIIYQPLIFEPGTVTTLSPVPPPGGGVGEGGPGGPPSGGGGSVLGPILAGLVLLFGALGFPLGGAGPPLTTSPAAAPGAPPPIVPGAPPLGAVPPAAVPPGAAPSPPRPVALVPPSPGKGGQGVTAPGPTPVSRGRRPMLPFTGANLLAPMSLGAGLIVLGLLLRNVKDLDR
jgi:hypothetical protein